MRHALWITLAPIAIWAAWAGPASAKPARWSALADCSAYYQLNARLPDPSRPASMTGQMSEVAGDYANAARSRFARQRKVSPGAAEHAVAARIKAATERLGPKPPRVTVERLIDKCPQPDS